MPIVPTQLELFVDGRRHADRPLFDVLPIGGADGWLLRSWKGRGGVAVQGEPRGRSRYHSGLIAFRVHLRLGPPRIEGLPEDVHWDLTGALSPHRDGLRNVFNLIWDRIQGSVIVWDAGCSHDLSAARRWLNDVARYLAAHCHQRARRLALRFRPEIRFAIYGELARDRTGRLCQLALSCPGALSFLAAASRSPAMRGAVDEFRGSVVAGRRLDGLVDDLIRGWARAAGHGPVPRAVCERWRLLLRKAGPQVAPAHLLVPPPLAFIAEDVPTEPRRQARWFQVMASDTAWRSLAAEASSATAAFSTFVARNALRITQRRDGLLEPRGWEWLEVLCARGCLPARKTDPRRLAALVHGSLWVRDHLESEGFADPAIAQYLLRTGDAPLPAPPFPDLTGGPCSVTAIRTVQDLVREGREMGHCVGTGAYACSALLGKSFFFSARLRRTRLTIELQNADAGFRVRAVHGKADRSPTSGELRALERWRDHVRRLCPVATGL